LGEGTVLRGWALPLLRCLGCGGALALEPARVRCGRCGKCYRVEHDVTDFLANPHPMVDRERRALLDLDRQSGQATARLRVLLGRLDAGGLSQDDAAPHPCLGHALDCRGQVQDVLDAYPLSPGAVVAELGADHCWASSLFLDAGGRVIAVDITEHLRLAPRAADDRLCRIQADMNALPLRDASVDVVFAIAAAHHSWDLARTFSEAARVLRPDGRLLFCCEPMPSLLRYTLGKDFGHAEKALGINETWIPRSKWLQLAAQAGLKARLLFPDLDRGTVQTKLRGRGLPGALAPLLTPFRRTLQVSIHLVAVKA
jgi:SAM-dependent methyltransferase